MAWTFNTWSEWTDTLGRNWRVVVAAGALASGGGALYWWERPQPRYPAAQDEAVLLAAAMERFMVVGGTNVFSVRTFPTNTPATNAIGFYPSWAIITNVANSTASTLQSSFLSGAWIDCRPDTGFLADLSAFADDRVSWPHYWSNTINAAWWTTHIGPTAWQYPGTNGLPYVRQAAYSNLAQVLSVMQARTIQGSVTAWTNYLYQSRTVTGVSWSDAISNAFADVPNGSPFGPAVRSDGPFEGVWLQLSGSYSAQVQIYTTDYVLSSPATQINGSGTNYEAHVTVDAGIPVWPYVASGVYVDTVTGVPTNTPFLWGSVSGSTNTPVLFRPRTSWSNFLYIAEAYDPATWFLIGANTRGFYGSQPYASPYFATRYIFTHLTNAAAFWP